MTLSPHRQHKIYIAATIGYGLGSKDQIDRVAQKIESGQEIPDNDKDAAIILDGEYRENIKNAN